jgi:hypothetical protein
MRHLVPLEPCRAEGAYRYLTVREKARSVEIVLLHQLQKSGKRKTRVVARIPRSALEIHDAGYQGLRGGGSLDQALREIGEQVLRLATYAEKGIKTSPRPRVRAVGDGQGCPPPGDARNAPPPA